MNPISKSKFALQIGVTPQYMPKIEAQLSMVSVPGKKKQQIDLHGAATLRFLAEREIQIKDIEPPPPAIIPKKPSGLGNHSSGLPAVPGGDQSKNDLEKLKIIEATKKLKIENEQKRGNLIDKKLVKRVFDRLHNIDENQLKPMGINVMPKVSALYNEANASKAKNIIKTLGLKKDVKSEILNILSANEEDNINEGTQILEDAVVLILKAIQRETDKFLKATEAS